MSPHRFGDHHELIAAEPARDVAFAYRPDQPLGDGEEHEVADVMAMVVVGRLEVVDVEEQQRQRRRRTAGSGEAGSELLQDRFAVGELGEPVVGGFVGEPLLELLPLDHRRREAA